jgi:hypothetical protein
MVLPSAAVAAGKAGLVCRFEVIAVTIVRVGATKKYSDGWEQAFGKGKKKASATATAASAKKATSAKQAATAKKAAKTSTKKKSAAKKAKKR